MYQLLLAFSLFMLSVHAADQVSHISEAEQQRIYNIHLETCLAGINNALECYQQCNVPRPDEQAIRLWADGTVEPGLQIRTESDIQLQKRTDESALLLAHFLVARLACTDQITVLPEPMIHEQLIALLPNNKAATETVDYKVVMNAFRYLIKTIQIQPAANPGLKIRDLSAEQFSELITIFHAIISPSLPDNLQGSFRTETVYTAHQTLWHDLHHNPDQYQSIHAKLIQIIQSDCPNHAQSVKNYCAKYHAARQKGLPLSQAGFTYSEQLLYNFYLHEFPVINFTQTLSEGFVAAKQLTDPIKFAVALHHLITNETHPFAGRNGHLGRFLLFSALQQDGIDLNTIRGDRHNYLEAVKLDLATRSTTRLEDLIRGFSVKPNASDID